MGFLRALTDFSSGGAIQFPKTLFQEFGVPGLKHLSSNYMGPGCKHYSVLEVGP